MSLRAIFKKICVLEAYKKDAGFRASINNIYNDFLRSENWSAAKQIAAEALENLAKAHPTLQSLLPQLSTKKGIETRAVPTRVENNVNIFPYYFHPQVKPTHIQANGMLLSTAQIKTMKKELDKMALGQNVKIGRYNCVKIPGPDDKFNYYAEYQFLGNGKQGDVFMAQNQTTGEWCAIKKPNANSSSATLVTDFETNSMVTPLNNEKKILEHLGQLKGYVNSGNAKITNFSYLTMPLLPGVSLDSIKTKEACAFILIKRVISLLEQTKALHAKKVLHCDLGLVNILCDINDDIHLLDYGSSKKIPQRIDENVENEINLEIGTLSNTCRAILKLNNINLTENIKSDIENHLNDMKKNALSPTVLDDSIQFFRSIQKNCFELLARFKKIGYVSSDEVLKNGKCKKSMLKAMQLMDKVYICENKVPINEALLTRLAKNGVRVAGIIKANKNMDISQFMLESAHKVDRTVGKNDVNTHFYITKSIPIGSQFNNQIIKPLLTNKFSKKQYKKVINKISSVSLNHFIFVIDNLQEELTNVGKRHSKYKDTDQGQKDLTRVPITADQAKVIAARKQLIKNSIQNLSDLYANGTLTQKRLLKELKNLERNMVNPNLAKRFFASIFGYTTQGAKNIHALRDQVQANEIITLNKERKASL